MECLLDPLFRPNEQRQWLQATWDGIRSRTLILATEWWSQTTTSLIRWVLAESSPPPADVTQEDDTWCLSNSSLQCIYVSVAQVLVGNGWASKQAQQWIERLKFIPFSPTLYPSTWRAERISCGKKALHEAMVVRWTLFATRLKRGVVTAPDPSAPTLDIRLSGLAEQLLQWLQRDPAFASIEDPAIPPPHPSSVITTYWQEPVQSAHKHMEMELKKMCGKEAPPAWVQEWMRRLPSMSSILVSHWMDEELPQGWIHPIHFPFYVLSSRRDFPRPGCWGGGGICKSPHTPELDVNLQSSSSLSLGGRGDLQIHPPLFTHECLLSKPALSGLPLAYARLQQLEMVVWSAWKHTLMQALLHLVTVEHPPADMGVDDQQRLVRRLFHGYTQFLPSPRLFHLGPVAYAVASKSKPDTLLEDAWDWICTHVWEEKLLPAWKTWLPSQYDKYDTSQDMQWDTEDRLKVLDTYHHDYILEGICRTPGLSLRFLEPLLRKWNYLGGICKSPHTTKLDQEIQAEGEKKMAVEDSHAPSLDVIATCLAVDIGSWTCVTLSPGRVSEWWDTLRTTPSSMRDIPISIQHERVRKGIHQLHQSMQAHWTGVRDRIQTDMIGNDTNSAYALLQKAVFTGLTQEHTLYMATLGKCDGHTPWPHPQALLSDMLFGFVYQVTEQFRTEIIRWMQSVGRTIESLPDIFQSEWHLQDTFPAMLLSHWIDGQLSDQWLHPLHFPGYILQAQRTAVDFSESPTHKETSEARVD